MVVKGTGSGTKFTTYEDFKKLFHLSVLSFLICKTDVSIASTTWNVDED